jgi:hypothetical protein
MIFVTEEVFIGQLFDVYIFRMNKNKKENFYIIFIVNLKVFHKSQLFLYEIIQKMKFLFLELSKSKNDSF